MYKGGINMKSEKILILYRDGNYKWKKLKKLTKDDMNKKEIKYLLIPSIKNPLLFYEKKFFH